MSEVQEELEGLINDITFQIDQSEVDEVEGESADMMLQKQII